MKKHTLGALIAATLAPCATQAKEFKLPKEPNVILIMTDDQGYGDFGFTGNPYAKTPNIDRLASESIQLTNYHTNTTSSPTRASLMSGMHCNSVGVWHTTMGRELLNPKVATIADIFKKNGYSTAMFGKWHLGDNYPYRPFDRGFDYAMWHNGGGIGSTPDYWFNTYFDAMYAINDKPYQSEGYCTDVWFDGAKDYIKEHKDKPFFCYISTNAPHAPHEVAEEYAKPYEGNDDIPSPRYYGMIENIDDNMGSLESFLKTEGLDKSTIILFTTDNGTIVGASADFDKNKQVTRGYNAGMRGHKGTVYDGGHRTPMLFYIPGNEKSARTEHQLAGAIDIAPTLCDMLDLSTPDNANFDGISLLPILHGEHSNIDRYLFTDTHRQEFMNRDGRSCVMKGDWRLINRKELYSIADDPAQKSNIADKNPDIVAELLEQHNIWWESIAPQNEIMNYIPLSNNTEPYVDINCHEHHHIENGDGANAQSSVRKGARPALGSFIAAEVVEDGIYDFELYRWPVEADTPLCAPYTTEVNGKLKQSGKAITGITGGRITIGEVVATATATDPMRDRCVKISGVELKRGKYNLYPDFICKDGDFAVFYLRIIKRYCCPVNINNCLTPAGAQQAVI